MSYYRSRRRYVPPRWITARFDSDCTGCGARIKKGDDLFYYRGNYALCKECGSDQQRQIQSEDFDLNVMWNGSPPASDPY